MSADRPTPEFGPFQFVILVLSVFVLSILAVEMLPARWVAVPAEVRRLLSWIDNVVCIVFLADFVVRFRRAPSKMRFMRWGWIDLLASLPEIELLRWGRVFRMFRLLRLVRAVRTMRDFLRILYASRTQGGFASVLVIVFLVLSLSSIGILLVETDANSNINTAGDALWWSVTTITTVGYGDTFPVTSLGRIFASALMITGVGMFGTFSGLIATVVLGGGAPPAARVASEPPEGRDPQAPPCVK